MDRPTMCGSHRRFERVARASCFTLIASLIFCGSVLAQTSRQLGKHPERESHVGLAGEVKGALEKQRADREEAEHHHH